MTHAVLQIVGEGPATSTAAEAKCDAAAAACSLAPPGCPRKPAM